MKEENSYEQFEILFGDNLKCGDRVKQLCKYLNFEEILNWILSLNFIIIIALDFKFKLDDILNAKEAQFKDTKETKSDNDLVFDWIPTDVPANLVRLSA